MKAAALTAHRILAASVALAFLTVSAFCQNVGRITNFSVTGADVHGNMLTSYNWDTYPTADVWKAWLVAGEDPTGPFVTGPTYTAVQPNLHFPLGRNTYRIFVSHNYDYPPTIPDPPFFGLNLFFDDATAPDISVYAPTAYSTAPNEAFAAIPQSSQTWWENQPGPGAGTLTSHQNGYTISVRRFFFAAAGIYLLDRVGPYNTSPDNRRDNVGLIDLAVTDDAKLHYTLTPNGLFTAIVDWQSGAMTGTMHVDLTIDNATFSNDMNVSAGSSPQQFKMPFNLPNLGVGKFQKNAHVQLHAHIYNNGIGGLDRYVNDYIPIPIVCVPGIDPFHAETRGGDGTWPKLEKYLNDATSKWTYPYVTPTGSDTLNYYPTVYNVQYWRNFASFAQGAGALASTIYTALTNTYSAKVQVVAHSKGTLVTRQLLEGATKGQYASEIREAILCVGPHVGSTFAEAPGALGFAIPSFAELRYENLFPLYPWYQTSPNGQWQRDLPLNQELITLNTRQHLAAGPKYYLFYTREHATVTGFDIAWDSAGGRIMSPVGTPGDGIVPEFSQRAFNAEPNLDGGFDPLQLTSRVGAFSSIPSSDFQEREVTSGVSFPAHSGYMDAAPVDQAIFTLVLQ